MHARRLNKKNLQPHWLGLLCIGMITSGLSSICIAESGEPAVQSGSTNTTAAGSAAAGLPPHVKLTAEQDHARIMRLLGIESLRRWRDGLDPQSPYYPNYDEARANPYPDLPDPLRLENGQRASTPEQWWRKRRAEIVEKFEREIYGRVPSNTPAVAWQVQSTTTHTLAGRRVLTKMLVGKVDNSAYPHINLNIRLSLTTLANATTPVPVMMQLGFGFAGWRGRPAPFWQQIAISNGWGFAVLEPTSIQADTGAGLTDGIIGLCNKGQPRKPDDWGALRAWAWGASRALDYFETDPAVDAKRVGVQGHSRFGKAALLAMAFDQRFAIVYASSSGAGGAKILRRNWGETVENLASSGEYHWMAGNFLKYAGPLTWADLPVDAHELIALCAPRPVFIGAGSNNGDAWVDAKGMFIALVAAGPVYRLLGAKGVGTTNLPPIGTALLDGELGFRQHEGGHDDGPNWPVFIEFARRHFEATGKR